MAASDKALEVKASVTIGGESIHPTKVGFVSSLNNIAQSQISYIHKSSDANKKATNVTSSDIFEAMGERQMKSFKDTPDSPDTIMSVQDAYEGSLEFKGSTSAPSYTFSAGMTELTEDIQPDYAALNCFDLTCYNNIQQNINKVEENPPSNLATLIKSIVDKIMDKGMKGLENMPDGITKKSAKKQHEINQKVVKFVHQLLDNSTDTMGWESSIEAITNKHRLIERITTALVSRSGGFFNNILHLAEEFQCVYVPETDNVGKLVNKKSLLEKEEELSPHIISLSARAGSLGMFPIRAVAVVGVPLTINKDKVELTDKYHTLFPEEPEPGGSILQVQGPQWLPESGWIAKEVKPGKEGGIVYGVVQTHDLTTGTSEYAYTETKQEEKKQKAKKENVLKDWAKIAYMWHALGQAYAILTTELDLKVKIGTRYKVKSEEGKTLFSGILNTVEHTISTGHSKSQAYSYLQFSHVIMGSAKIPGID